ncbi:amidohydrolase family protein, partial [Enterococcus faecalis]
EKNGSPVEGLMPSEVMNVADALVAHTADAAQALSRQDIGSIKVGQLADLCILSKNILSLSEKELLEVEVTATIFNGAFVYQKDEASQQNS